ncbi:MAG TPA: hypothetical protein VFV87_06925 [Pirellulaceae bacterium]|nr:hypothetical protein [Pirellulaceae bacterium]
MAKVIVERPRGGGGVRRPKGCRKRERLAQADLLPSREGYRRRWVNASYQKHLNEHLSPLRRYLASQVGRPWNKVHSEISRHLRLDSAVQSHVLDHLDDFVERHVLVVDGEFLSSSGWNAGRPLRSLFYVCPRTGLLRRNKRPWRRHRQAPQPPDFVTIDNRRQLHRIDGLWYEITLVAIAPGEQRFDVLLKSVVGGSVFGSAQPTCRMALVATAKRQLNKREIRRAEQLLEEQRRTFCPRK